MDFGGILNKLDNDKLGMALGSFMTAQAVGKAWGTDFTGYYTTVLNGLITDPHFPNLGEVMTSLMGRAEAPVFKGAISAAIVGYLLEMIDLHPQLEKVGKVLKTLGLNAAIGSAVTTIAAFSGAAHSPLVISGSGSGSRHGNPFENRYGAM